MSDLISAGGDSMKQFGRDIQDMSQGNYGPMTGRVFGQDARSLLDEYKRKNDPTQDPYKPDQPIVYDDKGNLKPPSRNPYMGLLSAISAPPAQQASSPAMGLLPLPNPQIQSYGAAAQRNIPTKADAFGLTADAKELTRATPPKPLPEFQLEGLQPNLNAGNQKSNEDIMKFIMAML